MNLTTVFFLISRVQILMRFVIPFCDTNVDIGEVATYLLSGNSLRRGRGSFGKMFFRFLDDESGYYDELLHVCVNGNASKYLRSKL